MSAQKRKLESWVGLKESKKVRIEGQWRNDGDEVKNGIYQMVWFSPSDLAGSTKIACFDLDGTLIETASGRKFAADSNDWKLLNSQVKPKLKSLVADGFKLCIFTNQGGIDKGNTSLSKFKSKIEDITSEIGLDIQVFLATGESQFRKPSMGMWDFMVNQCNQGIEIDKEKSFYVGDAAGRAKDWIKGRKKDFSCSDRKFAVNCDIEFHTPEEFFEGMGKARFSWLTSSPESLIEKAKPIADDNEAIILQEQEMIIMVGMPASGKSSFCKKHFHDASLNYIVINRDTLKTQDKCIAAAEKALQDGKSVVVDNTNPCRSSRKAYIDVAKKLNVKHIRCFHVTTDRELAKHLNFYRQTVTNGKVRRIPDVGYNVYKSKFVEPDLQEGLSAVKKVPFLPDLTDAEKTAFMKWYN